MFTAHFLIRTYCWASHNCKVQLEKELTCHLLYCLTAVNYYNQLVVRLSATKTERRASYEK